MQGYSLPSDRMSAQVKSENIVKNLFDSMEYGAAPETDNVVKVRMTVK